MTTIKRILLSLALVLAGPTAGHAVTIYNAGVDFAVGSNPNGAWSYGYQTSLGGTFIAFTTSGSNSLVDYWNESSLPYSLPEINNNNGPGYLKTDGPIYATRYYFADEVMMHPGQMNERAVLRWTAPTTGTISIDALFTGRDSYITTTDVHVLKNGVPLFNDVINGFFAGSPGSPGASVNAQKSYVAGAIAVNAGDYFDFVVGYGTNNNYSADSTGLRAVVQLQPVPVPAAVWMFGGALGLLGLVRRKALPA